MSGLKQQVLRTDVAGMPLEWIDYRALSDSIPVCHLDFQNEMPTSKVRNVIIKASKAGNCHAVAFWFELHLDEKTKISTLHGSHSNHWKQALQFLPEDYQLLAGDFVKLEVTQNNTGFEFSLKMEESKYFVDDNDDDLKVIKHNISP